MSNNATEILGRYTAEIKFSDIPAQTVDVAKACLIDAIACAVFGSTLPWSRVVADFAKKSGGGGSCRLPGMPELSLHAPQAALAFGAFAHAFELDNLRKPGAGVHAGATVALPALMMGQACRVDGKTLLTAIVAGCEVMFRIGAATLHTPEKAGFHAPGLTGPFGSAAACGRVLGLSANQYVHAFGIAGSLASGLLAFVKADQGGMVKRLHLGRAAEGGVMAAELAAGGYEGPATVLDGEFGLLEVYCDQSNPELLTAGLGEVFETDRVCFKSYPCHITAHSPVQLLRNLMQTHEFSGDDIQSIEILGSKKMLSHHNIQTPQDVMMAQYSVPFSVALSAYRDPHDPRSFLEGAISDPDICSLSKRVTLNVRMTDQGPSTGWGVDMTINLKNGNLFSGSLDIFDGCPERPLPQSVLSAKFTRLTEPLIAGGGARLLEQLYSIENIDDVSSLDVS